MSQQHEDRDKLVEQLRRDHRKLDARVLELEARKWLTPAEEQEVRRLKVAKLAKKDQLRMMQAEV